MEERTEESPVTRRTLPGRALAVSAIGFALDPEPAGSPHSDRATISLLQLARRRGITTFDTAVARSPPRAERLIAAAFPQPDPELTVIAAPAREPAHLRPSSRGTGPEGPTSEADTLRRAVEETRRRLAPQTISVLELVGSADDPGADPADVEALDALTVDGAVGAWALRVSGEPRATPAERERRGAAGRLYSVAASLLDPAPLAWAAELAARRTVGVFVRNPFADGRLDGRRYSARLADRAPTGRPTDVRSLAAEFEPVRRLGFLALRGRRTLAQAAVRFLLDAPGVASVLVPVPPPERLGELLGSERTPALTEEELARLAEWAPGPSVGSRGPVK